MQFEVSTVYNKQDMAAAVMAFQQKEGQLQKMRGAIKRLRYIACIPILLIGIYLLVAPLLKGEFVVQKLVVGVLVLTLCVWLFRSKADRYYGFVAWRIYPYKGHRLTFRLYDTHIEAQDGKEKMLYPFDRLEWMGEDAKRFVLLWAEGQSVILRKKDVKQGKAEDLTAFLESVSGKKMIPLE